MGKFPHGPQYKNLRIHFDVTTRIETERYQDATACSPCLFVLGCCFSPACCEQKQLKQCHPFSSEEIFHFHLLPLLSHWWTESCLVIFRNERGTCYGKVWRLLPMWTRQRQVVENWQKRLLLRFSRVQWDYYPCYFLTFGRGLHGGYSGGCLQDPRHVLRDWEGSGWLRQRIQLQFQAAVQWHRCWLVEQLGPELGRLDTGRWV